MAIVIRESVRQSCGPPNPLEELRGSCGDAIDASPHAPRHPNGARRCLGQFIGGCIGPLVNVRQESAIAKAQSPDILRLRMCRHPS